MDARSGRNWRRHRLALDQARNRLCFSTPTTVRQNASFASGVPLLTWYTYGDTADPTGYNQEAAFGLLDAQGRPIPRAVLRPVKRRYHAQHVGPFFVSRWLPEDVQARGN